MTRSRFTPRHTRLNVAGRPRGYRHQVLRQLPLASAISAILAGAPAVHAATEAESNVLEEVVVTAQKRTENLQSVPISIEVLSGAQLEQLDVTGLDATGLAASSSGRAGRFGNTKNWYSPPPRTAPKTGATM